jgi:uncharacterized delta-60 repeat protein
MRRFLIVTCILLSFLSVPTMIRSVTAEATHTALTAGIIPAGSMTAFTSPGKANTLIPLSDGRMLIGGSFVSIGGQAAPRSLAIIKSDDSLDTSFQVDPNLQVYEVYAAALQSNGKIVIAGWFKKTPVPLTYFLLRLNSNGTLDDTFNTTYFSSQVFAILVDGEKIVIGGNFSEPTPRIARLNQDGTTDSTFNGVGSGPDGAVRSIARQGSGQYIIAGEFGSYNGATQVGLARLDANGALDASFVPGGSRMSKRVAVLNDDSVLLGGEDVCGDNPFAWYSAAGVLQPALSPDPDWFESITAFLPLADGGFLIGGWYSGVCIGGSPTSHEGQVWRYAADGTYHTLTSFGDESDVLALALQRDGKVMLGGQGRPSDSTQVGVFDGLALLDLSNNGLEKVTTFTPLVGDEAEISSLSRYADGRLLVAGFFSHVDSSPRFGLARVLANGTFDPDFHPFADKPEVGWSKAVLALPDGRALAGYGHSNLFLIDQDGNSTDLSIYNNYDRVSTLALQSDGKVLVGTDFGLGVRRLKDDFSGEDGTFTPGDAYGAVYVLAVQASQIYVAGDFSKYNNMYVPGLVRLDGDGNIDGSFNPPDFMFDIDVGITATLYSVAPLSTGKVLVGGNFVTVDGADHPALVRLNNDGTLDTTFTSPAGVHTVKSISVQGDGSIWIGGTDSSNDRNPLVFHLNPDGQVDSTFQNAYQAAHNGGVINAVLSDSDGLIWAGGKVGFVNGQPFFGLAKYFPLVGELFLPILVR